MIELFKNLLQGEPGGIVEEHWNQNQEVLGSIPTGGTM